MQAERFGFGPFVLDARRGLLERAGSPVTLGNRAVALLLALVRAEGRPVTKDELVRAAWPSAVVEESNLSVQVASLRKSLGTTAEGGEYVVTVARIGYRFGAAVSALDPVANTSGAREGVPSMVVLPLANLGGDAAQQYLAHGLTEDIIMALSRFRWFRVIGRPVSLAHDAQPSTVGEFTRRVDVRYALEGSVRRSGDRVVINARLIDGADDAQLWGERFDLHVDEATAVHDTIAMRVAAAVEPEMLKTASAEAARRSLQARASVLDLVHRGVWLFHRVTPETHAQARELFREACRLDRAFGEAQFWLARVSAGTCAYGWSSSPADDLREGLDAAMKAIRADERDPYAHYSLAIVSVFAGDQEQAMRAADRSVQLAPAFALGHLVGGMARLFAGDAAAATESLAEGLRLNAFDPQNFAWLNVLAHANLMCDSPGEALAAARRAREVRPGWRAAAITEICSLVALGDLDRAHTAHLKLSDLHDAAGDSMGPLWNAQPEWGERVAAWVRAASDWDAGMASD